MKQLYLFAAALLFISFSAAAQHEKINCDSLCVKNISFSPTGGDSLDITLYNGDSSHINYPMLIVIYNGDTVAYRDDFYYYAHMGKRSQVHYLKTTLTQLPPNFSCKVVVIDPLWKDTCITSYPCAPVQHLNVKNIDFSTIKIYPNPARNILNIDIPVSENNAQIQIFSVAGKEILSGSFISAGNQSVDITGIKSGMYFVRVISGKKTYVQKFVKE